MKFRLIALGFLLLTGGVAAHAGALLKPTSGVTQALRAKSLDVKSDINGAFAQTTVTTIYDNPNDDRIEADFIYSAPEGAVVTGFAYWYNGEKVVARVVEKERAAQIYQYITSRMRDPALVEMIGKNTFRARIFPVEPRTNLKIEVQFAQMLRPTKTGWQWKFGLREETDAAPLDSLTMRVHVGGGDAATSNAGRPDAKGNLGIKRENFVAKDDVRVQIAGARPRFYAARDGGSDGFFALALKGNGAPKISGVKTYDLTAQKAGGARYVFGRYRGQGGAVAASGAQKIALNFGNRVEKSNVASQLWAANFIENLSQRDANRDRVIALSKRFGMPSKWTSWLAIPAAERENFKKQILASDRESAARAYAAAVARGDVAAAEREKKRVAQVTKELVAVGEDYSSDEERQGLGNYLNQELKNVRRAQAQAKYQPVPRAKMAQLKTFERNLRRAGAKDDADGVEMPVYLLEDELRIASRLYAGEVAGGRGNGARAKQLQARLKELAKTKVAREYGWDEDTFLDEQVESRKADLALEIAVNRLSNKPSASLQKQKTTQLQRLTKRFGGDAKGEVRAALAQAARLRATQLATQIAAQEDRGEKPQGRARLNELAKLTSQKPDAYLKEARTERVRAKFDATTDALAQEIVAGRADGAKARQLQAQFDKFARISENWTQNNAIQEAYQKRSQELASAIEAERGKTAPDSGRIGDLRAQLNRSAGKTGNSTSADEYLKTARTERVRENYNVTTDQLVSEVLAGRETSDKARQLQTRVEDYAANSNDPWQRDAVKRAYNGRSHQLAYEIEAERARSAPDQTRIAQLETQLGDVALKAGDSAPQDYLNWEKRRVAEKQGAPQIEDYRYRVAGLDPSDFARGYGAGDPLLQISAPADARSVVAIMPNGEIKPLEWRAQNQRWEANFDIPMDTRADSYLVTVVIVDKAGKRHTLRLRYRVDAQAPKGDAKIQLDANAPANTLSLEVGADDDTTRVVALLPWGERLVLRRGKNGAFAAQVALPATWLQPSVPVRFILVDSAHNRTELNVDWNR